MIIQIIATSNDNIVVTDNLDIDEFYWNVKVFGHGEAFSDSKVGNEVHFVAECDCYTELRREIYSNITCLNYFLNLLEREQLFQLILYFPRHLQSINANLYKTETIPLQ